eukprot:CAMPEP_0174351056 /NCGR_PEP_ID=MMETSP0811_2-20130205/8298_1 /TAXON_ID=73025 ORGANISM="Eutreptiella gymnastica-like, Strain CCMP1594" /NCGR_SAMPLE_ID=MMETSP0811_2 /ASSEMBLY_ACC=CAM_ASM_000667 /LENGTH=85 /DNA_ID=CAMNT_0015479915 /DNA_START=202 /DNA_END=455 /DNA_ORIENTATION=+
MVPGWGWGHDKHQMERTRGREKALQEPPECFPTVAAALYGGHWAVLGWARWSKARAIALLRVDPTLSSEAGPVRGLRWHNLPREG